LEIGLEKSVYITRRRYEQPKKNKVSWSFYREVQRIGGKGAEKVMIIKKSSRNIFNKFIRLPR